MEVVVVVKLKTIEGEDHCVSGTSANPIMPNNKRHTIKQLQGKGKEKVHPGSRKAGQLDRISLRADKLSRENRMRKTASHIRSE